jgi:hypothetical protein
MGRRLIGTYGLAIAVGLACPSAKAGDRNSAGTRPERQEVRLVIEKHFALMSRPEKASIEVIRPFRTSSGKATERRSGESEEDSEGRHEHKSLTLFRFNSKFGEVAVKPVIGHVNGAQFSIGF